MKCAGSVKRYWAMSVSSVVYEVCWSVNRYWAMSVSSVVYDVCWICKALLGYVC